MSNTFDRKNDKMIKGNNVFTKLYLNKQVYSIGDAL